MPVLKSAQAAQAMKGALVLDLGDVRRQAARMVADAKVKARQIVETAQGQKQRISTEAHDDASKRGQAEGLEKGLEEGRRQGRDEALREASQQLQQLEKTWLDAVGAWEGQLEQLSRDARQAVIDFALAFARKLVHRVIEIDEQVVVDQVAAALSHVLRPFDVNIRIHPQDRPALERAIPNMMANVGKTEHVRLIDDQDLSPGGCVVTHGQGVIDATIETQLRRIVELIAPEKKEDSGSSDAKRLATAAIDRAGQRERDG